MTCPIHPTKHNRCTSTSWCASSASSRAARRFSPRYKAHMPVRCLIAPLQICVGVPKHAFLDNSHPECLQPPPHIHTPDPPGTQHQPQIQSVTFDCAHCKNTAGPFAVAEGADIRPDTCNVCERQNTFRLNQALTVYRNYQKITLQESPGTVPAGRVPRCVFWGVRWGDGWVNVVYISSVSPPSIYIHTHAYQTPHTLLFLTHTHSPQPPQKYK